jgi:DNA repair photolyase
MYSGAKVVNLEANKALERSRRLCAREYAVVNLAEGCLSNCMFCPVRHRHRDADRIGLRANLPELLEREIHARRRQGGLPVNGILFNTSTDCFQPVQPLLTLAHESMRLVLEEGLDLTFFTRGVVPEGFADLFSEHSGRVHAQVSLFSMDDSLVSLYEPDAPRSLERLDSIRRMIEWGVDVRCRIDPLMPFISDTVGHLEELIRNLRSAGISHCSASYLVLRPHMLELFQTILPTAQFNVIKGSFKGQAWQKVGIHQMTKLLPERTRAQGYQRLRNIGKKLGITASVCACHNPNIGISCLSPSSSEEHASADERGQMDLFGTA